MVSRFEKLVALPFLPAEHLLAARFSHGSRVGHSLDYSTELVGGTPKTQIDTGRPSCMAWGMGGGLEGAHQPRPQHVGLLTHRRGPHLGTLGHKATDVLTARRAMSAQCAGKHGLRPGGRVRRKGPAEPQVSPGLLGRRGVQGWGNVNSHRRAECGQSSAGLLHVAQRLARDWTVRWVSLGRPVGAEPGLNLFPEVDSEVPSASTKQRKL